MSAETRVRMKPSPPQPSVATVARGLLQRKCACGGSPGAGGECAECQKKRLDLQRKEAGGRGPATVPPIVHEVLGSPGYPLDHGVRSFMESRFGHDFSRVRIHTDSRAAESARAVNALAYTVGQDLAFGAGRYVPESVEGQRLIAHELTHVVQQSAGRMRAKTTERTETYFEQEAERAAAAISGAGHEVIHVSQHGPESLARNSDRGSGSTASESRAPGDDVQVLAEIPITFVGQLLVPPNLLGSGGSGSDQASAFAPELPGGISYSLTDLGLGAHVLASGDLSWLKPDEAARRVLSRQYWSPLVPSRGTITLDRLLNTLPRSLVPRIESEIAAGKTLSWIAEGFTEAELLGIPSLVQRLNERGVGSLTAQELALLRDAVELHIGGSSEGAPFASHTRPNFDLSSWRDRRYRVRVEIPRSGTLDVSVPNEFNQGLERLTNAEEAEFLVTANQQRRIVSVQRMHGSAQPSFLMRYSGAIRWGGRAVLVVGIGASAYRMISASSEERPAIIAEEVGGLGGGALGTSLGLAGCLLFGVATGGVGLFLCGLGGGIGGGLAGSSVFGTIARNQPGNPQDRPPCPSCHEINRRRANRNLFPSSLDILGDLGTAARSGISGTRLRSEELQMIRRWLEANR